MKKVISLILCLALITGVIALPASALQNDPEWDEHPIVFLQGYSGPQLKIDRGLETERFIWGLDMNTLIPQIIKDLPMIVTGIILYAFGNKDLLVKQVKSVSDDILEPLTVNDDGTSKYNVTPYPYYANEATAADLTEAGFGYMIPEDVISADIMKTVPADKFYVFASDWRLGQIVNADRLDKFIDEVLAETGSTQVDIYGLSHGGQLGATYLYRHGLKGKVDNAVLNVPAIGGTSIATALFDENGTNFNVSEIIRFATIGSRVELNLEGLAKILPQYGLNAILSTVMRDCFFEYVTNFGSVWDFVRPDEYEATKAKYLDPVKNAGLIAKTDEMHRTMGDMSEGLSAVLNSGTNIYIMSNCGVRLGTGQPINSDYIVDTASSSGAYVTPLGEHFADNYVQKNTTCTDPSHNHISPSRDIDASTCYLPENTWFTYGQFHGQAWWDPYTHDMLLTMLLTDDITDIYSDPAYPQFEIAQNPKDFVYACFKGESQGYTDCEKDDTLIIRNLSKEYSISITSIEADGSTFGFSRLQRIKPGEQIEIPCSNLTSSSFYTMKISFVQHRALPTFLSREIYFSAA